MKQHAADLLLLVGSMFLYGIRNIVGKWLVTSTLSLLNRIIKDTEKHAALWLHKQARKPHYIPKDCIKDECADI